MTNEGQYEFEIREDGKKIAGRAIDDPFIVSTVEFHLDRRDALKAIFRPLIKRYEFRVRGQDAAYRVVFQGDYTPPERGPTVSQTLGEASLTATAESQEGQIRDAAPKDGA